MSDSMTLWTVAHHALLLMGFSRKEYWRGSTPGHLLDPEIKLASPALQANSLPLSCWRRPQHTHTFILLFLKCWQLWTQRNKTKAIWSSLRELWKLSKMIWQEFKCHICLGFAHLISKKDQFIDNWRKQSLLYE